MGPRGGGGGGGEIDHEAHAFMTSAKPGIRHRVYILKSMVYDRMANRFNIYSYFLISKILIIDINNSGSSSGVFNR